MFSAAVITASDKGYAGEREDISGAIIHEILLKNGFDVKQKVLLPDDKNMLTDAMTKLYREKIELIITTGGTGFSKRDVTPEATRNFIEREAPGISEAIRAYSMTITKRAMLSRGISGIKDDTLVVNLPGSPKAVEESLLYILDTLKHGLEILNGKTSECGRMN